MDGNRALVDMDGVLLDYAGAVAKEYPDMTSQDMMLWMKGGVHTPGTFEYMRDDYVKREPDIFLSADHYTGAWDGMMALTRIFDRVSVVTLVNSKAAAEAKEQWLTLHKMPHDELICRSPAFDKGNIMAQLYLEDNPATLMSCRIKHPDARTILFRRLWNMHSKEFETVSTWSELIELVEHE